MLELLLERKDPLHSTHLNFLLSKTSRTEALAQSTFISAADSRAACSKPSTNLSSRLKDSEARTFFMAKASRVDAGEMSLLAMYARIDRRKDTQLPRITEEKWESSVGVGGAPYKILICLKIVDLPDSPVPRRRSFTIGWGEGGGGGGC